MKVFQPIINHKCKCCGLTHTHLPLNSRAQMDINNKTVVGFFFECSCGSTMFIALREEFEVL
jgi:hypothetical protein